MMSEPKAFASLSAGLLARKGAARPAMRRQPLSGLGLSPAAPQNSATIQNPHDLASDDLGWNDMGYDVDPDMGSVGPVLDLKPLLAGSVLASSESFHGHDAAPGSLQVPEVVKQQAKLAKYIGSQVESGMENKPFIKKERKSDSKIIMSQGKARKSAPDVGPNKIQRTRDKAAFTLRLDAERHLRLRLASAVTNRSSQAILSDLLDDFLASMPEIGDLAGRVPAAPPARMRNSR